MKYDKYYGTYTAADAFIAGHLVDWIYANKKYISQGKMIQLIDIMEKFAFGEIEDPIKAANHLRILMQDVDERIKNESKSEIK